ncbi:hypothetical protein Tco_0832130 [Tanacetum coccineum]
MFLNMDQLEKQLDKEEFQEIGSMADFKVLETQFQMFIKLLIYLDDEYVIQTIEEKVDMSKALDASLVDTESSGTESKEQDTSSRSGNDAHTDDADIRPIYDEEPMNGNSFKPASQTTTNTDGSSTTLIPSPVTADEKTQKKNDVKARSMLLMTLPNEHLLTFNQYKDAKTLFAAIQTRFGGNDATKKTQKTLLKQMYENFSAPSTESLDYIFNRLQNIVSQLAILGENISQEDLNLKFLRSLPSEWKTHVVVWKNKPDLDTMSFDDLYNNFKIVEQEVKGTTSSSSSSSSQNLAFVSSTSSTNEVNTAYEVSTANTQVSTASTQVSTANLSNDNVYAFLASQPNGSHLVHEDLKQIHEDDLEEIDLKWQLALLSMRTRKFFQKTGRKITINESDIAGYDKSKKDYKCGRNFFQTMLAIDGVGFDWSFMADEEFPIDMALMAFSDSKVHNDKTCSKTCLKSFETLKTQLDDLRIEFNKSEFNLATYKRGLASVEEQLVFYKKNEVIFYEQLAILKRDISYKDLEISVLKSELEKLKQEKESNQLKIEKFDNASKSLEELIGSQIPNKSRKGLGSSNSGVGQANYNYHQRERMVSGNNYTRVNFNYSAKKAHPSAYRNIVPRAVLMKTGLRPLNTTRPVNTAHPKTTIYSARPMPKAVNTARPNSEVVNVVKANQMCDKKNSVLFTDTGCFIMSPDFKLADESQVLLKVPRKNNMYSVDIMNIVPKESLTCLVAKATLDE